MPPSEETNSDKTLEGEWKIRDCEAYSEEYSDCTSIRARLHQYFVFGSTLDCSQWKRDYDNCCKWIQNKDIKAANELIKSETNRRMKRLKDHYANNVWEKRSSPPEDWSKPLPDYIAKKFEHTYLHQKSQELKGENKPTDNTSNICILM